MLIAQLPVARHRYQTGVTLVELMVAMVIGIFLLGAVAIIYVSTSSSARSSTLESQMNEDATLALELIRQQLQLAGFSDLDDDGNRVFSGIAVRGCDGGFDSNDNTSNFSALACAASDTGPDALAIRFQATPLNSQVTSAGAPSNCSFNAINAWTPGATEGSTTAIRLADNRYYIANDDNNGNTPTLYCKGRGDDGGAGTGFSAATPLVPNIENMQLTYAVTLAPTNDAPLPHQVTAYVEAGSDTLGSTLANWSRVAAVRVCLLARSDKPIPLNGLDANTVGTYVDCAGTTQTANDRYLRRAYITTVQLRNMRPALPAAYETAEGVVTDPWAYLTDGIGMVKVGD